MTAGRVVVVGSIHVDVVLAVDAHPEPGETVRARSAAEHLGGKGANQAVASSSAGAPTRMIGVVGETDGARAVAELDARGVDTSAVRAVPGAGTGRAVVTVDGAGENRIVVSSGANLHLDAGDVRPALAGLVPADVVLLQNEIPIETARAAVSVARSAGARVVWNAAPAPHGPADLLDCDVLVVNEGELAAVRTLVDGPAGAPPVEAVRAGLGTDVVATRGAAGSVFAIGDATGEVPAPVVPVVDTTAAGDTFVGYLCAEFVRSPGGAAADAIRVATSAAALAVTREGAAASIPTRDAVTGSAGAAPGRNPS
ncbi:Ribokinase [Pseudonocardia sp. Ae168_Ps1]|uniref:ribokinase n=1 Tax=unclassified Pseudonocardia TaxID=2619320 RepID=UPI00094ADE3D|nr:MULTISPECIES: ribokinase [unclassified Pseudonocardia]OLL72238.1 Ribokinase [Pseudonocardia sp. Ae150A_Ps1]OLL78207.1 Ribokinase [Pseudonocardia sp. Ae168_Ps1]OLL87671.1 Ribokinase [Pseudonocardia sp. Ae263_Ps1]OLL92302.1 Ribokinase [Pseudonocardia sp. Ae356_Ps1]